jgi:RNA polymerase sigma-70 factor, ECF subfamily
MRASLPESKANDKGAESDAELLRLCQVGNERAAAAIHKRYEQRVRGLAQRHWPASMRSRYDPDDIVQEVFDRFFRAVQRGLYSTPEETGLWGFLLVVTLNQIRKAAARHLSRRRDVRQTVGQGGLYHSAEGERTQDSGLAQSNLVVEEFMASLPEIMRQVVKRRLEGYTVAEIARDLTISQRATERLFQTVRQRIGGFLELSALPAPSAPIRLRQGTAKTVTPATEMVDESRKSKIA